MLMKMAYIYSHIYTVFQKNGHPFYFFHNSLKWWSIYTKFLSYVADEMLIQNIWLLVKYSLLVVMLCWRHSVARVQTGLSQPVLEVAE